MGMLLKVYKHNGWCYVRSLGNISSHPVASFPFGRAQYQNSTAWQDKITGRYVMPKNTEMRDTFNPIHGSDEGLLVNSYKTAENMPNSRARTSSQESILYGNALTIRIKPGQFAGFPLILCVLYGEKGDNGNDELLIVAVQDLQIVTYYRKRDTEENAVTKTQTGIYLNDNDRWSSIGLNFSSSNGLGLAGVYHRFSYHELNILPLNELNYFWLFDFNTDTWVDYEDENGNEDSISPFNGGVAQAEVYSNALTSAEFAALLDKYNDNDDQGVIYIDKPSGGVITKIYTETKKAGGSTGGNGTGGSTGGNGTGGITGGGNGGGDNNGNDIGGNGTQKPTKP
ncbi:hypothetical protein [Snodgrassella alvi]|uniref:Uncharacterized protein n=2 Tax=Snodgrassella alvi TaxID=1196083 RepID=A0A855FJ21_9NEIS|nr:hypothetical protein [Snodgrassella alvi]PIT55021.1 hypothetical protein BHC59_11935 [Snodgrassella alvi]PIT58723.1 hypothetical protein BHC57_11450 [Snodgrassella alvi]